MPTSPADFQLRASGWQSVVTAVALIVGAAWTVWTFRDQGVAQRSKVELQRAQADLNEARKTLGEVTLDVESQGVPDGRACNLSVVATVHNAGRQEIYVDLDSIPPLRVARVADGTRAPTDGAGPDETSFRGPSAYWTYSFNITGQNIGRLGSACLVPGESVHLPFLAELRRAGTYFVQFVVPYHTVPADSACHGYSPPPPDSTDGAPDGHWTWSRRAFVRACLDG